MEASKMKTMLFWVVISALVGSLAATWLAPKMISWYFQPPASMGFSCADPITWALGKLQMAQVVGVALGIAGGVTLYFSFFRRPSVDRK